MSKFSDGAKKAKKGVGSFFKKLLILVVVLFIGLMFFFYYASYSEGTRAGVVLKVSKKGAIFKTYEGQLDLLSFGAVKSENKLSQTFEFSVEKNNKELYEELQDASLSGERVRLEYTEKYVALPWRGDTKYFVTDLQTQKGNQNNNNMPAGRDNQQQGDSYPE